MWAWKGEEINFIDRFDNIYSVILYKILNDITLDIFFLNATLYMNHKMDSFQIKWTIMQTR